jgi:outer membrane protein
MAMSKDPGAIIRRLRPAAVLCLLLSIGMTAGCAGAKIESNIGLVDPTRLLNDSNTGKRAKDSLAAFSKNRQALIEMEEKELRRMEEDFVKQASVLSQAAKNEREQLFRRRMAEYQQKAGELNREVQEKQKEVLDGFRDKVDLVVGKVAKRHGMRVVLDKGKGGPALYGDEALDITDEVIEEFNREYP